MNRVRESLSLMDAVCGSDYPPRRLVLEHGVEYTGTPWALPKDVKRGRMKRCFFNAWNLAVSHPRRFTYCEGYAGPISCLHAWCVTRDGRVVDPTWRDREPVEYLGIPLRLAYVNELIVLRTGSCGSVIDNWEERWPMATDSPTKWKAAAR